jgi:hypothetical protein
LLTNNTDLDTCILQIGIMLCGLAIDSTVIGGPAYNSRLLDRDDVIVRVDGIAATQVELRLPPFHLHYGL